MLVRSIFDKSDNSFLLTQHEFDGSGPDPILRFGPLTSPISSLFSDGWHLACWGFQTSSKTFPLRVVRGREAWRVGRLNIDAAIKADSLTRFVKMTKSRSDQTITRLPVFAFVESDPFKTLADRYPRKKPDLQMIGNQTLREFAFRYLLNPTSNLPLEA